MTIDEDRRLTDDVVSPAYAFGGQLDPSKPRVLVMEHDPEHGKVLWQALDRMGYAVEPASHALEGLRLFAERRPDVVLIDVLLPGLAATEVCRRITASSDVPVIMITSTEEPVDIEQLFEAGASDCLARPERTRELVARIERVRRPLVTFPEATPPFRDTGPGGRPAVTLGSIEIDFSRREVRLGGGNIHLPRREFDLLALLVSPPGQLRTRAELIDMLWSGRHAEGSRTLDTHIRRLRQKLEAAKRGTRQLVTVRGVGFRFDVEGITRGGDPEN